MTNNQSTKNIFINEWKDNRNFPSSFHCIDVHAHYVPEAYRQALINHGQKGSESDGLPTPTWTPESHLEMMDKLQISTALLSLASPHCHFGNNLEAAKLTRNINEYGASLVSNYSGKFKLLATLPLPDIDNSLREMAYALDTLCACGIKLPTNASGVYLGDEKLDPIFSELNRRKTVVVLHPVKPPSLLPNLLIDCPVAVIEYLMETTRTIVNLILNGTLQRYPNIKIVVPHGGALLTSLVDRLDGMKNLLQMKSDHKLPDIRESLSQMYFDLAGFPVPNQLQGLLHMTDASHLLYGSDWPYAFDTYCLEQKNNLLNTDLLTADQKKSIFYDNAIKLFFD